MEVQVKKIGKEEKEYEEEKMDLYLNRKDSYQIVLDGKKVGMCSFTTFDSVYPHSVEARYILLEAYRDQKLSVPVWKKIKEIYEKTHPDVQRIYCLVAPNNIKSIKIVRKDMQLDYEFYSLMQKEGSNIYYPYYAKNPYYQEKEAKKELTYKKRNDKINK